eukprot:2315030-Pleurochrysis_carterae.AAC.1
MLTCTFPQLASRIAAVEHVRASAPRTDVDRFLGTGGGPAPLELHVPGYSGYLLGIAEAVAAMKGQRHTSCACSRCEPEYILPLLPYDAFEHVSAPPPFSWMGFCDYLCRMRPGRGKATAFWLIGYCLSPLTFAVNNSPCAVTSRVTNALKIL